MIKHIVMFKFRDDTEENKKSQLNEVKRVLDKLPEYIPEIRDYEVGINVSKQDRAYDLVVISSFDTLKHLYVYRNHPAHLDAIEVIAKYKVDVKAVDFES